jgi:dipeptidyl-peptidase 4
MKKMFLRSIALTSLILLIGFTFAHLLSAVAADAATDSDLTIKRIFSSPELDGSVPTGLHFSPNGKRLSFLRPKTENYEVLDLWEYDLSTGQPKLLVDSNTLKFGTMSEAEKARRERMRITRKGIVEYFWSHDASKIVFPAGGDLYLYSFGGSVKPLTWKHANELDVKFSPKDKFVSFVRGQDLYVLDLASGKEHRVTHDGKDAISNGIAEFIAQEEMDRFTGYWWSEDDKYLAFTRTDESPVKWVDRYDIDADSVTVRHERYPETGSANAIVKLGVVRVEDIRRGKTSIHWIPLNSKTTDFYLADVHWTPEDKVAFQIQTRDQKKLDVEQFDPATLKKTTLFSETDPHWVNLNQDWKWLKDSNRFIWASERSGFKHLYLYDNDGKLIRPLTQGQWPIDSLSAIDEKSGWVYFTGWMKSPLEKHLYRVSLESAGEPEQITKEEGWHNIEMSKDGQFYVQHFSAALVPTQVSLHKADGGLVADLSKNEVKEGHPLFPFVKSLLKPEYGSFKGPSGDTLYYRVYKPKNFDPKKKYPLVVTGYGGPHVQFVEKSWGGKWELFSEVLAQKGFVVASFDNRGSARRGKVFEDYLYRAMGTVEIEDQVAGVKYLVEQGFINKDKVGYFGWSYGGYMALSLALKAPDIYHANVAVAPVTDFALYDTHYTERYLGKPQDEPKTYKQANALEFVPGLKGHLLVMHGMADDNVLFTNSTLLFKKLQQSGKLYESVTYPGAKHGISGKENQTHVFETIADYFERNLK